MASVVVLVKPRQQNQKLRVCACTGDFQSQRRDLFLASSSAILLSSIISQRVLAQESNWLQQDQRRLLHAVMRVGDINTSFDFYQNDLGMQRTRFRDFPEQGFNNGFVAYGNESSYFSLELTQNYGISDYRVGDDVEFFVNTTSKEEGIYIDPTGYKWQNLKDASSSGDPISKVLFKVSDLDKSTKYYTDVFGMQAIDLSSGSVTFAYPSFGNVPEPPLIELVQKSDSSSVDKGEAYVQLAVSTLDVYKTGEQIKNCGGEIVREPGPVPGIGTKIVAAVDPDGWKYVFVDNDDFLKELQ